jgi:hypothetical protein
VYFGRQQLWEVNTSATTTTTAAAAAALDRSVAVNNAPGFLNGDTVVIEPTLGVGVREYLQIAPADSNGVIISSTEPGNGTLARICSRPRCDTHTTPASPSPRSRSPSGRRARPTR